jgi:hypothetical protein
LSNDKCGDDGFEHGIRAVDIKERIWMSERRADPGATP